MEITNILQKTEDPNLLGIGYPILIRALYPFAPHLTSDLWFQLYDELEGADGEKYIISENNAQLTKILISPDIRSPNSFISNLRSIKSFSDLKVSLNGKFLGVLKVNLDDGEILENIKQILKEKPE